MPTTAQLTGGDALRRACFAGLISSTHRTGQRLRARSRGDGAEYLAEPLEQRQLLTAIGSDQTLTGTIAAAGQVDSYTFSVVAGQSIMAAAAETVAGSPFQVFMELRSPSNAVVTSSGSATGTQIYAPTVAAAGTYTLNISGNANTTGGYAVTLALAGSPPAPGSDAGAIASGAYRLASISTGDLDVHTISGVAGGSLVAAIGDLDASGFDPSISVFSPSGTLLGSDTAAAGANVVLTNLPATGTYYVIAYDQFSDETGNYAITVASFGGGGPQAIDADSGPIASGGYATGTIDLGDLDIYSISGQSAGSLLAAIGETATSGFDPQILVFSPSGALLDSATSAAGTNSSLTSLAATGTYYVVALDQFSDETGSYALSAATFGGTQITDADSGPTGSGQYRTGTIDAGDFDVYTISGTQGGSILATIGDLNAASTYDPQVLLYAPTGALLDFGQGAIGTVILDANLPTTGTYYLVALDQFSDETGSYALTLGSFAGTQTTDADSAAFNSGERRTGTIAAGDFDVYTIQATTAGSLLVGLGDTDPASGFDPNVVIFSPSGTVLNNSADALGTNVLLQNLATTGTYYIAVLDQFADETGAYGLSIARFGGAQTTTPGDEGGTLLSGQYQPGRIQMGDFDVFQISASAGNTLVGAIGDAAAPQSTYDPQVMVFGPTGTLLANEAGADGASLLLTNLAATGTYTVVTMDQFGDETGDYGMTIDRFGTGAPVPTVAPGDEGGPLVSGERRGGRIAPGDIDAYSFNLVPGNGAFWTLGETIDNTLAPRLIVIDPNGGVLFNLFNARGRDFALTTTGAALTGTYSVLAMDGTGGTPGEYALTGVSVPAVQAVDADSGALASGQTRAGSLPPGDADVYTTLATPGQPLTFSLAETGPGTLTPALIVYGPTGTIVGSSVGASTAQVSIPSAVAGTYTAIVEDSGGDGTGAYSVALNAATGTDNFQPSLLESAYRFDDRPPIIRLAFSEDVSASFDPSDFTLTNLTTSQNIDPANLAITFKTVTGEIYFGSSPLPGGVLPDGNYHLSIPAGNLTDAAGNPLTQPVSLDFFVLAADANRDRRVDTLDFNTLAANFGGVGKHFSQADFNYDGTVDTLDFNTLAAQFGKSLLPPARPGARGVAAAAPAPTSAPISASSAGLFSTQPILVDSTAFALPTDRVGEGEIL